MRCVSAHRYSQKKILCCLRSDDFRSKHPGDGGTTSRDRKSSVPVDGKAIFTALRHRFRSASATKTGCIAGQGWRHRDANPSGDGKAAGFVLPCVNRCFTPYFSLRISMPGTPRPVDSENPIPIPSIWVQTPLTEAPRRRHEHGLSACYCSAMSMRPRRRQKACARRDNSPSRTVGFVPRIPSRSRPLSRTFDRERPPDDGRHARHIDHTLKPIRPRSARARVLCTFRRNNSNATLIEMCGASMSGPAGGREQVMPPRMP